jgi:hypothetical protein
MAKTYDITLRHLEDAFGADWASVLPKFIGLPPDTKTAPLDTDLSVTSSQADKLYTLSGPVNGVLHLELESGWSGDIPKRLLLYSVLAEERHGGPVYSTVILLRPEAKATNVTGELVRTNLWGEYHRFRYAMVPLWQLPAADLLAGPIGVLPLALLTDDARPRLPELVREMDERVSRELGTSDEAHLIRTACALLLGLRYDKQMVAQLFGGVTMLRESAGYQWILDEGRILGKQDDLLRFGSKRFGSPTPEIEGALRAIRDLDRLDRLIDTFDQAKTWDEWLQS